MKKLKLKGAISPKLALLYLLGFILNFCAALPAHIESSFLEQYIGLRFVSVFFFCSSMFTIIAIIFFPHIIKRFKNYRTTKYIGVTYFVALLGMAFSTAPLSLFIFFVTMMLCANLIAINMDIFVEDFSKLELTGTIRGTFFTFMGLGWVLAPLLAGVIAQTIGYEAIFIVAAMVLVPFFILLLKNKRKLRESIVYEAPQTKYIIKKMWRTKNLRGVFGVAVLLNIFFGTVVVYLPMHLYQNLGFNWGQIGLMTAIALTAFVIFEIPAGILADKIGEKRIMAGGFMLLIAAALLCFLVDAKVFGAWVILLFLARTGAALVEAMREAYFFKQIAAKDVGYINIFRSSYFIGFCIASIIGVCFTKNTNLPFMFLILAGLLLSSFYFIHIMKDTE